MEAIIGLLIALAFILIIVGVPIYVSLLLTGVLSLVALGNQHGNACRNHCGLTSHFQWYGQLAAAGNPVLHACG